MSAASAAQSTSDFQVIFTAVTGLVGIVVGALFANWDKIFRKARIVEAPVVDYAPSDDFEIEIRTMLERSGQRKMIEDMQDRLFGQVEAQLVKESPGAANEIKNTLGIYREELPSYDEFVALLVPIWEKYYTLTAAQELNKFYSTKVMRDFVSKNKHVMDEYWPKLQAVIEVSQQRAVERLELSAETLPALPREP